MILPPYPEHPKMVSEDIVLRELKSYDVRQLVTISFYDGKRAVSEPEAAAMLERIQQDYLNGESIHWGIEEKISGKIVGTCGYYRGFKNTSGELGFVMLPQYRGKGYMAEALRLAIAFGFKIGLRKIIAVTTEENLSAVKLLERLKFKKSEESGEELRLEILREGFFRIRKYRIEDQQQVLKLLRLNSPDNFHPSEEVDLQEYLKKEAEHYFVTEALGAILAAGGYNTGFDSGKTARISWDMVHPEFQGLGIGKELTTFRITEIKKSPEVQKIVVRTTPQAEKFYEKLGFQKSHFEKDFWAPGFDLVVMQISIR